MGFPPLGNSDDVVVSVSIDYPANLKWDALFYHKNYDCSHDDWDGILDNLRDAPWDDIFKLTVSAAASEFWELLQVGTDFIPYRKYQVKLHSPPWFSAGCSVTIVHRNHIFCLY